MTPAEAEALGRRYLAAGGRWREGMLAHHDLTGREHRMITATVMSEGWWPDLRDPATLGCVLAEVRERLEAPHLHLWPFEDAEGRFGWKVRRFYGADAICEAATEPEALIAALEVAPAAKHTRVTDAGTPGSGRR